MTESTGTQAIDDAPAVTQAQQSAGATDAAPAVGNATPAAQDSLDATADAAEPGARAGDEARDDLVAEGDAAGDYLERLLDILDYDGDIDLDVEGERAVVSVIGTGDVNKLVGDHGEVLDALQELTRLAAGMETGQRSRLMLDIAGYRAKRRAELTELGLQTAQQVVSSGEPVKLGAMNPFERKIVHDAVATVDGATSSSEGEEPRRRVVVSLAG
jgi:spoIIIJ-associated protein